MIASKFAKSVSIPAPSVALNPNENPGCLRAKRSMIASRYTYLPDSTPPFITAA